MGAMWQAQLLRVTLLLVLQSELARFFVKAVSFSTEQPNFEELAVFDWQSDTTQPGLTPGDKRQDGINPYGHRLRNTGIESDATMEFLKADYAKLLASCLHPNNMTSRQLIPKHPGVNDGCYDDLMDWFDVAASMEANFNTNNIWALKLFDAFGKPSAGLMAGVLQMEGNYDECMSVRAKVKADRASAQETGSREFGARYCRVELKARDFYLDLPVDANKYWTEKQSFHLSYNWGVCLPDSCYRDDLLTFLTTGTMRAFNLNVDNVICFNEPTLPEDAGALVTVIILACFLIVISSFTLIDVYYVYAPYWNHRGTKHVRERTTDGICLQSFHNVAFEVEVPAPDETKTGSSSDDTSGSLQTVSVVSENDGGHVDVEEVGENVAVSQEVPEPTKPEGTSGDTNGTEEANVNGKCEGQGHAHESDVTEKQNRVHMLASRFSLYSNFLRLISTDNGKETFTCVQGLKVISMAWIIAGHGYTYGGLLDESNTIFKNTVELVETSSRISFHLVGSAHLAVDTFFVISGFLVMVITLRTMEVKCKPKFWLMYFVHRFWRLTPLYMIVLAVGTNLYDHIVKGPLKADEFEEFYQCKDKWWSHMLYFNNFYRPDKKCMTWSWYMSVDMQLYVLSSIFVYITHRKRKLGVALTVGLLLGGIVSAFIAEYVNGGQFVLMDLRFFEYWSKVYTMPYTRMSVYAVGLLLGVAITEHKGKPLMSLFKASIVWVVAIVVGLFLVFINHTQWRPNSDHWTNWQQSLYESLVRPTWAVCVAWVVYACCTGLGGVVNSILSWQPFVVLSRLTYAVYLLHPVVITFVVYSRRTPIYLDPLHLSLVYNYLGNVVITYLLAAVFSLTFEIPTMALEKILLQGK